MKLSTVILALHAVTGCAATTIPIPGARPSHVRPSPHDQLRTLAASPPPTALFMDWDRRWYALFDVTPQKVVGPNTLIDLENDGLGDILGSRTKWWFVNYPMKIARTDGGYHVQGRLPWGYVEMDVTRTSIRWSRGASDGLREAALGLVTPALWEGTLTCAGIHEPAQVRLVLPESMARLSPTERMKLLAVLLTFPYYRGPTAC
jgi:hypothetical protein